MKHKYLFLLLFIYFSKHLSSVYSLEIMVSNEISQAYNETSNISTLNLVSAFKNYSHKNSDLIINIMSNEKPYIIDILVKVTYNLNVRSFDQNQTLPNIAFENNGGFELNENFTIVFEKIRFSIRGFLSQPVFLINYAYEFIFNVYIYFLSYLLFLVV